MYWAKDFEREYSNARHIRQHQAGVAATLCFFLALLILMSAVLTGCVQAPIAPNLKLPEPKPCKVLNLPPVPQHAELWIDGDKVRADKGGKLLLQGYVESRSLYQ